MDKLLLNRTPLFSLSLKFSRPINKQPMQIIVKILILLTLVLLDYLF